MCLPSTQWGDSAMQSFLTVVRCLNSERRSFAFQRHRRFVAHEAQRLVDTQHGPVHAVIIGAGVGKAPFQPGAGGDQLERQPQPAPPPLAAHPGQAVLQHLRLRGAWGMQLGQAGPLIVRGHGQEHAFGVLQVRHVALLPELEGPNFDRRGARHVAQQGVKQRVEFALLRFGVQPAQLTQGANGYARRRCRPFRRGEESEIERPQVQHTIPQPVMLGVPVRLVQPLLRPAFLHPRQQRVAAVREGKRLGVPQQRGGQGAIPFSRLHGHLDEKPAGVVLGAWHRRFRQADEFAAAQGQGAPKRLAGLPQSIQAPDVFGRRGRLRVRRVQKCGELRQIVGRGGPEVHAGQVGKGRLHAPVEQRHGAPSIRHPAERSLSFPAYTRPR
ncbi:hypothetical protein DR_1660 [Deinococcus radiodurans R1 = ATCC 13939 = DSM 20539]|uniref:Uncharacterized protein n=1 Tax=Deinococcus radiodurans (strain ATCC 13939 / DSM 20539 / JCM 16871 / CCUG 27074 / LMG 4051 / NBRC 15346 / NCIMB 9279 / VKM B-1422 / R1) TaxID=243230 RepID=Q9RTU6_DEIRA|nr:hypothetical protein DR_1660 [Deinococcus radiodurans R1 = ATCC 13939 = DSM 20539]